MATEVLDRSGLPSNGVGFAWSVAGIGGECAFAARQCGYSSATARTIRDGSKPEPTGPSSDVERRVRRKKRPRPRSERLRAHLSRRRRAFAEDPPMDSSRTRRAGGCARRADDIHDGAADTVALCSARRPFTRH